MTKLINAPLQEAIFEIRWELDQSQNPAIDLGFALAQGKLQEIVGKQFPTFKRKAPYGFPEQFLQYQVVNQHWHKPDIWPVLQLGPGIFTVNDTDGNYDWTNTYYPLIKKSLDWVNQAYDDKLKVTFASLRYIDSVRPKDYGFEGKWKEFISEHFNFSFMNDFSARGTLKAVQFEQYFELEDKSSLHVAMNSGKYRRTDEDALIWQTAVVKNDNFEKDSLLKWVDYAHNLTSDLFKEMTKQKFYDSFSRKSNSN